MGKSSGYNQYCPLAQASEILCTRWTMLVLRELSFGYTSFNDISRGVPRMSRSLLSTRLKDLTQAGIVEKKKSVQEKHAKYGLTPAGESLTKVIRNIGAWSQEWLEVEYALETLDSDHLMWNVRYSANFHKALPNPFIAHFILHDQPLNRQNNWLIFENEQVSLCIIDDDFDVDVEVNVAATTLAKVYMGWTEITDEINAGNLKIVGDEKYTSLFPEWFGRSGLAGIPKRPKAQRVSVI